VSELRKKVLGVKEEIGIEDEEIKEVIRLGIEFINRYIDVKRVKEELGIKEDRTLVLRIVDVPGEVGFAVIGDKLKPLLGIERPTTIVEVTKDVFWALVTGKLKPYDCWLYDLCRVKGEYSLRDAVLLSTLFEVFYEQYKDLFFGG